MAPPGYVSQMHKIKKRLEEDNWYHHFEEKEEEDSSEDSSSDDEELVELQRKVAAAKARKIKEKEQREEDKRKTMEAKQKKEDNLMRQLKEMEEASQQMTLYEPVTAATRNNIDLTKMLPPMHPDEEQFDVHRRRDMKAYLPTYGVDADTLPFWGTAAVDDGIYFKYVGLNGCIIAALEAHFIGIKFWQTRHAGWILLWPEHEDIFADPEKAYKELDIAYLFLWSFLHPPSGQIVDADKHIPIFEAQHEASGGKAPPGCPEPNRRQAHKRLEKIDKPPAMKLGSLPDHQQHIRAARLLVSKRGRQGRGSPARNQAGAPSPKPENRLLQPKTTNNQDLELNPEEQKRQAFLEVIFRLEDEKRDLEAKIDGQERLYKNHRKTPNIITISKVEHGAYQRDEEDPCRSTTSGKYELSEAEILWIAKQQAQAQENFVKSYNKYISENLYTTLAEWRLMRPGSHCKQLLS